MMLKKITRYLVIILLTTIIITIGFSPQSSAQLSLLTNIRNVDYTLPETPAWDLNKAQPCGKYWCSNVHFYNNKIFDSDTITVALPRDLSKTSPEVAIDVEQRAKFIQRIFQEILENIQQSEQLGKLENNQNWRFWLLEREKPLHPLTPNVEKGIENDQNVIYVVPKPELGLSQQTIITVTKVDARANGTTGENLSEQWRLQVKKSLSEAIWGLEMDSQQPFFRIKIVLVVVFACFTLLLFGQIIKHIIKKWKKSLVLQLKEIQSTLAINPESKLKDQISSDIDDSPVQEEVQEKNRNAQSILFKSINRGKKVIAESISLSSKFLPIKLIQKQNLIRQQTNVSELLINLLRLSQLTLILVAIASIVFTFRETRFLFNLFVTQAWILPVIWIVMVITDKVVDFWIDYALNKWAKERQAIVPNSNRPSLRVNTYSPALRGATSVLFTFIGIFISLAVIGLSPTFIASAGALAVVFAFLSRNLLEDMLNGILILATDRYAVGDVVEINGLNGCVETMNLYATSLRNLDGQLTVIPNGKISTVVNMTKNWSQVNFTVEVAWDTDIRKTMTILQNLADQMYEEEEWQDKMISSANILGIEQITHEGIMIRLIIATQPSMHWAVGREFRWRVKEAFDLAGIKVGIPQREIWHHNHSQINFDSN